MHKVGVTSIFLSSKYEDVEPLSSKIASERIAHRSIPVKEILKSEGDFLNLFDFEIDFITHYDFYHTYREKFKNKLKKLDDEEETFINKSDYAEKLCQQALLLVKMAIQNNDFTTNSPSILVLAALYAATAFLKHSKIHSSIETSKFCTNARKSIFEILEEDYGIAKGFE